jgi:hypothetical protein
MASERARPRAPPFIDPPGYARHRPEATLLYQVIERHYPELVAAREAAGRPLPKYVQEEFEAYVKCGRLGMAFCACAARAATPRSRVRSAVPAAFVPPAERGG